MTPELTVLALAGLLQGVQFTLMSIPANIELGPGKTMSPRDASRLDLLGPRIELVVAGLTFLISLDLQDFATLP